MRQRPEDYEPYRSYRSYRTYTTNSTQSADASPRPCCWQSRKPGELEDRRCDQHEVVGEVDDGSGGGVRLFPDQPQHQSAEEDNQQNVPVVLPGVNGGKEQAGQP